MVATVLEQGGMEMGALSILFIAAGAVLTWAVTDNSTGVDLHMIGIILLVVGVVGFIGSLATGTMMGFRSTRERHVSTDGRTVVESERATGF
jgi:predicted MFS family arabinose efflux permease